MSIQNGLAQAQVYDDLYTPKYAVHPLVENIVFNEGVIWECCGGNGSNISKVFSERGFEVIETGLPNMDFLLDTPPFDFDFIITNPPFSRKDDVLEKCYGYNTPFALLLPLTTLEGVRRGKMFREHGIQVLVLDRRVDYTGKGSNWQNTSWFCYDMLEHDLVFAEMGRTNR
jgi:hypothetical protein